MAETKRYIKKIKLPNDSDIRWIRDVEAVHTDEIGEYLDDYLPLTGGTLTGPVTATTITVGDLIVTNLDLGDIPAKTTTISNVLIRDESDNDKLKYHSIDNFLYEIGGIGVVSVDNNNTVIYSIGKNS